jgi:FkbM family methyltransferase
MIDEIWAFRKYDAFGHRVNPGDVVVDIGANIGTFSVYAAMVCGASRVLSFEPFPENYKLLSKNVGANQLGMVTCVNQAVAGKPGRRTFGLHSEDAGSHSLVATPSADTIEVECCTFEDIFERFGIDRIDYLKMDCEGAEYEILEHASRARLQQIKQISMEYHHVPNYKIEDVASLLQGLGFKVRFGDDRLYASRLATA